MVGEELHRDAEQDRVELGPQARHAQDGVGQARTEFEDLPSTLQRSPESARETFAAAKDSAEETYGKGERASRTAYSALKHTHEKVGDHWEPKEEKGPSDSRARSGGANPDGDSAGGVDANASKAHLYERAQQLDVSGRSDMTKDELVDALQRANDRETRRSRESGSS